MKKTIIEAAQRLLLGALELIENGMKPSDAVTCGASEEEESAVAFTLGLGNLRDLDEMSYTSLRRILEPYSIKSSRG